MVGRSKGSSKTTRANKDEEEVEDVDTEFDSSEVATRTTERKARIAPYRITSGESYMSDEQLSHFRDILTTWKRELMEEVDHTITEMKEATSLADPNDRATQEETFSLELRTRDRERKLIKKIEEALQQIKDKDYGYCEACGIEIGIRRLEARPTATLCIDCKTLAEIAEKRA
ncbi:MAG TPA: RNA polymerase-binding protein DksA [Gammaproteobacteria bacterium]|nr:RNA polymerase-binding protein DksA [Gammaproteobacteria bacterium]